MEGEAGEELRVEVGRLLRHDLAAGGDGEHGGGRRRVEEEGRRVAAGGRPGQRRFGVGRVVDPPLLGEVLFRHPQRRLEDGVVEHGHVQARERRRGEIPRPPREVQPVVSPEPHAEGVLTPRIGLRHRREQTLEPPPLSPSRDAFHRQRLRETRAQRVRGQPRVAHHAVVAEHGGARIVHRRHERHHELVRFPPRPVRTAFPPALLPPPVAVDARRLVPVMAVGDEERPVGQRVADPRRERRGLGPREAVGRVRAFGELRERLAPRCLIQERRERSVLVGREEEDGRQVGVHRRHEPEAIVPGPGQRALMREDPPGTRRLDPHQGQEPAAPALHVMPRGVAHMVAILNQVEGGTRVASEDSRLPPLGESPRRALVTVLARLQDQAHAVVRMAREQRLPGLGRDHVVGRGHNGPQIGDLARVVAERAERNDEGHGRLSGVGAISRRGRRGSRTRRRDRRAGCAAGRR